MSDWIAELNRELHNSLSTLALTGPSEVRGTAFSITPVGVQGRPQYPATDIGALLTAYTRNELVYAAINRKSKAAVDPRLMVEARAAGGSWGEVPGHPLRRLMMRPNPMMDEAGFMRAGIVSMDVAGVFYVEKRRAASKLPVELWPLNPAKVAPIPDGAGGIRAYEYRDGSDRVEIPAEDMLVRREYNPLSRYSGLAPLAVALGSVDADNAQTDYIRAFFNNAGIPSGIIKYKGILTQDKSDNIKTQWRQKYSRGWGRQHDVAVMDENSSYEKLGSNLEELSSEAIRSFTESRITMVFGVPPLIIYAYVGLLRATYSNLKEAWQGFWDGTLTPDYKDWRTWLTWNLLTDFVDPEAIYSERIRLNWDMSQVAALQEDVDAIHERSRKNLQAGAVTLNEHRAVCGLPKDPKGDYYLRPRVVTPFPWDTDPPALAAPAPTGTGGTAA